MSAETPNGYTISLPADVDMVKQEDWLFRALAIGPATNVAGYGQGGTAFVGYATADSFVGLSYAIDIKGGTVGVYTRGQLKCVCESEWLAGDKVTVGSNGKMKKAGSGDTAIGRGLFKAEPGDITTITI